MHRSDLCIYLFFLIEKSAISEKKQVMGLGGVRFFLY